MKRTESQASRAESTYESILQSLQYGLEESISPESDWLVIKEQVLNLNQNQTATGLSSLYCQRIFNIIDFLEGANDLHFASKYFMNPSGNSFYRDVIQCTLIYFREKINAIIEKIAMQHTNPIEGISTLCAIKELVSISHVQPMLEHTLENLAQLFDVNDSSSGIPLPTEWDIQFWDSLLGTLNHFNLPIQPWIRRLESFPRTSQSQKILWQYRLTANFFESLGTLVQLSTNKRDVHLYHMVDHFIDVPHRCIFAFNEIESPKIRCDAGTIILDRNKEIAESSFWQIHDCICHWSTSWYQFGIVLSYGIEYELLDPISLSHLHQQMNLYFQALELSTDTEEWAISSSLLEEWNELTRKKTG